MEVHHRPIAIGSHSPRKKWTHYFWEFLMLFFAAFCGFLAENKREHMIENNRAKGLVASLLNDLQHDTAQLNMLIKKRQEKKLSPDSLIGLLQKPPETIDRYSFYAFIAEALSYLKFSQSTGTISQLKNAGYLRYFSDNELIQNISNYEFRKQDYKSDEAIELEWIAERLKEFTAFNLDNSILAGVVFDEKLPRGTGVVFYRPDGFHNLKAIVNELRLNNHFMLTVQTQD